MVEILEIIQDGGKGKTLSAALIKERELRIENALNRKTTTYCIDVIALRDESQRKLKLGWQWLVAGLVMALVTVGAVEFLPVLSSDTLFHYLAYVVGLGASAACVFMAWKTTSAKQVFYSRNADVALVEMFAGKPSKKEFSEFIEKVEESIRAIQEKMNLSMKNQLAGEMRMLRRLTEEGVLSASDYRKAQAELLSKH